MIDKVSIINARTAIITYTDRPAKVLSSDYNIRDFVIWYLDNRDYKNNPFDEYRRAMVASTEDTTEINIGG